MSEAFAYRWVRTRFAGREENRSRATARAAGWEPVSPEETPAELAEPLYVDDFVLHRRPLQASRDHQHRMAAINAAHLDIATGSYLRDSHSAMQKFAVVQADEHEVAVALLEESGGGAQNKVLSLDDRDALLSYLEDHYTPQAYESATDGGTTLTPMGARLVEANRMLGLLGQPLLTPQEVKGEIESGGDRRTFWMRRKRLSVLRDAL